MLLKEKRAEFTLSKIIYLVWIVYFSAIYMLGNVYFLMPSYFSIAMAFLMLGYKLIRIKEVGGFSFPINSLMVWYGLFFVWQCIARIWTPDSIAPVAATPYQTVRILAILVAMDLYVICKDDAIRLIKSFCIGATIFAAWLLYTSPLSTYGTLRFGAITGQQRNTSGYALCFATLLLVYLFVEYKNKIWAFCAIVCFVTSLLTGSRKIIFAYLIALVIVIISQKSINKTIKYFLCVFLAVIIIIPLAYQIPYIRQTFGERLLAVLDDSIEDSSIMFRNVAKENAIRIFKESPIIGNGWAAVRNSFVYKGVSIYAHNNYLEVAADFGLVGCVLLFTRNLVYGFNCFIRRRKSRAFLTATILLISMILLDWGQVTYVYLYMICIWGVVYKFVQCVSYAKEKEEE